MIKKRVLKVIMKTIEIKKRKYKHDSIEFHAMVVIT